ncbi:hypothetical protein [Paenibacillus lutrae]|uniref:Uncharacterized protein n=1 Tax=Paenibacillus lutrae TaxID=2078573 RepID=A0A7X3JZZ6_9BACL|nr:hypothetical protein [Paenibacillus lutrae]MVP00580.1 hypothetical protein [Paenibacillus lutrae]
MKKNKKIVGITFCAAVSLIVVLSVTNDSQANVVSKAEKLEKLTQEESNLRTKFDALPENSEERNELGRKVKEAGITAGNLKEEINPVDPRTELEANLKSYKNVLGTKDYYSTKTSHPQYGKAYAKAAKIVAEKEVRLAEIEKDLKENKKPVDQLVKEFEELRMQQELIINN